MIVPKNTLLTNAKWSDITDSVLHYIQPKIHRESLISTNSYIDYDDAVNDGRLKAITVIEGVRHKWNISGKKVSDLVNFVLRCVANYYSTARQKGALSIDTSVNTVRIVEDYDSEDEDARSYVRNVSCEDSTGDVDSVNLQLTALCELLNKGFAKEYVVLRETLYPKNIQLPPDKVTLKNVCKALGEDSKSSKEIITNISVTLTRLGVYNSDIDKILKDNLPYFGILNR